MTGVFLYAIFARCTGGARAERLRGLLNGNRVKLPDSAATVIAGSKACTLAHKLFRVREECRRVGSPALLLCAAKAVFCFMEIPEEFP